MTYTIKLVIYSEKQHFKNLFYYMLPKFGDFMIIEIDIKYKYLNTNLPFLKRTMFVQILK